MLAEYSAPVIPNCPECGGAGVPLLFGLPVPAAVDAAMNGSLALGGCLRPDPTPHWQCPQQHRWSDADEAVWDEQLWAALSAHGYHESEEQLS
ncbi:hypothetical protein [Micromonospora sp. NBC_01796]|uniref:hypothetical protein n=1 Tax=Micromonospora sp. NBC_01796 TaxID=2975987 RepID=UPI002DD9B4DF|nr:hypothetical protein [Micromonospora sp. NBC_01796]WSA85752.1 hypothetical protein OIE47_36325 [Micromonospora sp. NBC_01796]